MHNNMKANTIIMSLAIAGSLLSAISCSDFLEQSNPSAVTSDNYWNNQKEAEAMLVGCYNPLLKQGLYYNYYNSADPRALDAFGTYDGDSGWWFWSPAENALYWGNFSAACDLVSSVWNACYTGIARCNELLANVPNMDEEKIDAEAAARIMAEAKFLRAFYYYYLTQYFRDVPLSTVPTSTGYIPVSQKSSVVDFIVSDLKDVIASNALPASVADAERGRASLGAAKGLLCRIYLYNERWKDAADMALDVMGMGYGLEDDYLKLFSEAGCTSKEIIFSVRFSQAADGSENQICGFLSTRNQEDHISFMTVTNDMLNEYYDKSGTPVSQSTVSSDVINDPANRDPRFGYNFMGFKSSWVVENDVWVQASTAYINKYQNWTENKWKDDQDYYVIRYADILLMRAEALVHCGGSEEEIEGLVNQVRDRASVKMKHVTPEEIAYHGSILNLIKHERRVEFAFEGLRYADLKRWGDYDKLREYKSIGADRSKVWPIPQSELDNNPSLVQAAEWGGASTE